MKLKGHKIAHVEKAVIVPPVARTLDAVDAEKSNPTDKKKRTKKRTNSCSGFSPKQFALSAIVIAPLIFFWKREKQRQTKGENVLTCGPAGRRSIYATPNMLVVGFGFPIVM